jgi:hypothetical protein
MIRYHDVTLGHIPPEEFEYLRSNIEGVLLPIQTNDPMHGYKEVEGVFVGEVIRSDKRGLFATGRIVMHDSVEQLPSQLDVNVNSHRVANVLRRIFGRKLLSQDARTVLEVSWLYNDGESTAADFYNY